MGLNSGLKLFTSQEPDLWEPETEDEVETGQDDEVVLIDYNNGSKLYLQQVEDDQTRDAVALATAQVGNEAQSCHKIIPGFPSLNKLRTQGGGGATPIHSFQPGAFNISPSFFDLKYLQVDAEIQEDREEESKDEDSEEDDTEL